MKKDRRKVSTPIFAAALSLTMILQAPATAFAENEKASESQNQSIVEISTKNEEVNNQKVQNEQKAFNFSENNINSLKNAGYSLEEISVFENQIRESLKSNPAFKVENFVNKKIGQKAKENKVEENKNPEKKIQPSQNIINDENKDKTDKSNDGLEINNENKPENSRVNAFAKHENVKVRIGWKYSDSKGYYNQADEGKPVSFNYSIRIQYIGENGKKNYTSVTKRFDGKIGTPLEFDIKTDEIKDDNGQIIKDFNVESIDIKPDDENYIYQISNQNQPNKGIIGGYITQNMNTSLVGIKDPNAIILDEDKESLNIEFTITQIHNGQITEKLTNRRKLISSNRKFQEGEFKLYNDRSFKRALIQNSLNLYSHSSEKFKDFILKAEFTGDNAERLRKLYSLDMQGNDLDGWKLTLKSKILKEDKREESEIKYKTVYEDDPTLEEGKTKVKQEGVNGLSVTSTPYYYVINEDGTKEIIKELTNEKVEKVEKKPVDKIILRGTKKVEKNKAPILEVKPSKEIDLGEKLDLKKLILKAFDPEDGEMIDKVVIDKGNFDNNKAGEYKIKFTLTDKDGLTTTALSTITVKEYKIEKEKEKDEKKPIVSKIVSNKNNNNNVKTGVGSISSLLALLGMASGGLFVSKKRK